MKRTRRNTFFIYKSVQLFILKIVVASCLLSVVAILLASLFFYNYMLNQYTKLETEEIYQLLSMLSRYKYAYFFYVLIGLAFTIWLIYLSFMKLSLKIAGPVFRMQTNLREYVESEEGVFKPISLRKNDQMQELARYINEGIAKSNKTPQS